MINETEATPLTNNSINYNKHFRAQLTCIAAALLFLGGGIGATIYGATWKEFPLLGGPDCSNSFFEGEYEPCDTTLSCETAINSPASFNWLGFTQAFLSTICTTNMCTLSDAHLFWAWANGAQHSLKTHCADSSTIPLVSLAGGIITMIAAIYRLYKIFAGMTATETNNENVGAANQHRLLPPPVITVVAATDIEAQLTLNGDEEPRTQPRFVEIS